MAEDLLTRAKSDVDFYALLEGDVHPGSSQKDIDQAYRRAALKHHPDKNRADPNAIPKFHALQEAYNLLSDPAARAAHDAARQARERRSAHMEGLDKRKREMIETLERGERDARVERESGADPVVVRIQEQNRKMIAELAEKRRREREERDRIVRRADKAKTKPKKRSHDDYHETLRKPGAPPRKPARMPAPRPNPSVDEMLGCTMRVRWRREGPGLDIGREQLVDMFGRFARIEAILLFKDRPAAAPAKGIVATAAIVFPSEVDARIALSNARREAAPEWGVVEAMEWWDEGSSVPETNPFASFPGWKGAGPASKGLSAFSKEHFRELPGVRAAAKHRAPTELAASAKETERAAPVEPGQQDVEMNGV
jgi:DnaJ family protein C protein 17